MLAETALPTCRNAAPAIWNLKSITPNTIAVEAKCTARTPINESGMTVSDYGGPLRLFPYAEVETAFRFVGVDRKHMPYNSVRSGFDSS